jgi:hypothetical protein
MKISELSWIFGSSQQDRDEVEVKTKQYGDEAKITKKRIRNTEDEASAEAGEDKKRQRGD